MTTKSGSSWYVCFTRVAVPICIECHSNVGKGKKREHSRCESAVPEARGLSCLGRRRLLRPEAHKDTRSRESHQPFLRVATQLSGVLSAQAGLSLS